MAPNSNRETRGNRGGGFDGIYFAPDDGEGVACKAAPGAASIDLFRDGVAIASLDYRRIEVTLAGMDDRYLSFESASEKGTERVLVASRKIADEIEALGAPRQMVDKLKAAAASRDRRNAGRWGILGAIAGALAILALIAWLGFGWAAGRATGAIPVDWEREIGKTASSSVLSGAKVCSDPELAKAIHEIGMKLVAGMGASRYDIRIRVLDSPEANAVALPGGYVFINFGLVRLADDGAEVAGVTAHEIQHVLGRHGLANMVRQSGLNLLLSAATGGVGDLQSSLMLGAAGLASMSYSRKQEREADLNGLALMYKARIEATGLPRLLKKLESESGVFGKLPALLSTHPEPSSRIDELNEIISSNPQIGAVPLSSDWKKAKESCSPVTLADPDAF